jgi:hypothetical protein
VRARSTWLAAALLVPACSFTAPAPAPDPADDPEDPYPGGAPETDDPTTPPDQPPTVARHCPTSDPTLRLCLDFDDQATIGNDGSTFNNSATCSAITRMARTVGGVAEQAGMLTASSQMTVKESIGLDIEDALTLSLWARPEGVPAMGQAYWLLDNNRQYYAQYLPNGKFRCGIGTTTVDAALGVQPNKWYHVGCVFDAASATLRVYVNGQLANCRHTGANVPTDGHEGTAIGSNIDAGPAFSQPFIGGLDNIQVFNRAFSHDQVCDAASNSGCGYTPICF